MAQNNLRKQKKAGRAAAAVRERLQPRVFLGGAALVLTSIFIANDSVVKTIWEWSADLSGMLKQLAGHAALAIVVVSLYNVYLAKFHRDVLSDTRVWRRVVLLEVLYLLCVRLVIKAGLPVYVIPTPLFALLLCLISGRRFSLVTFGVLTVLCIFVPGITHASLLVLLIGGIVAIFGSVPISSRWKLMETGVVVAFVCLCSLVGLWLAGIIETDVFTEHVLWSSVMGFAYIGILANACLPLIEYFFSITTHMTLLEISSQNHPLLRRLVLEAPGTYHHSLVVGNLAEAAAEAAGCDWLLARVGSYYHDVGKLEKPLYFTENITSVTNRHENLSPAMSSLIIMAHPKDGVQTGRDYNLPRNIIEFIEQHHGKSIVEYFYQQAVARAEEDDEPSPEAFRYAGPKPQRKEVGIVLLADAVEAATRSLSDPAPARIKSLVRDIVDKRIVDGQLDECPLTLDDLRKVRESFIRVLTGMYHSRVKYPNGEREADDSRDNGQANGSRN